MAIAEVLDYTCRQSSLFFACLGTMKKVSSIIHQFVQQKQWLLQHEFQYKRKILILDATDHQLVQKLFDTKPNKSHVRIYAIIYVTTFHTLI